MESMRSSAAIFTCGSVVAVYVGAACARFEAEEVPIRDAGAEAQVADAATTPDASDAASDAGCPYPSCGAATCVFEQFQTSCGQWAPLGDTDPSVVKECRNGKLILKAKNTLDARAQATYALPAAYSSLRVGARVLVNDWDGASLLTYAIGVKELATVEADYNSSFDQLTLRLCRDTACDDAGKWVGTGAKREHAIVVTATSSEVRLEVDCTPAGKLAPIELATKVAFGAQFGHNDASPIDGTLDDFILDVR